MDAVAVDTKNAGRALIRSTLTGSDPYLLSLLMVIEGVSFYGFVMREVSWFPPDGWDQAVYLSFAYQLQEELGLSGLIAIWRSLMSPDHFNGVLYPIEGGILGALLGGTRFPALLVNFIGFAAAQVATFSAIKFATNRRSLGYAAVGLVLLECTTWNWIGGIFDFRMDFIAFCLYGIWAAAVIRSGLYLQPKWSIFSAIIAVILLLHRFIAAIYVIGVSGGLMFLFLVSSFRGYRIEAGWRCRNLLMSTGIIIIVFLPFLAHNWASVHGYYVVGTLTGEEPALRSTMAGVFNTIDNLMYYPKTALSVHLGYTFLAAAAGFLTLSLVIRLSGTVSTPDALPNPALVLLFLGGASVWPLVALTFVPSKASQIAGIVGIPLAMLVSLSGYLLASGSAVYGRWAAASLLSMGLLYQVDQGMRHSPLVLSGRRELYEWNAVVRWMTEYAIEHRMTSPTLSTDIVSSRLTGPAVIAGGYEATRTLVSWRQSLGGSIFAVERSKAMELAAASDMLILTSIPKTDAFPFHASIKTYWPELKGWAEDNMLLAKTFEFDQGWVRIYVKHP